VAGRLREKALGELEAQGWERRVMRVRQVGEKKKVDYQYISPDGKKFASVASAISSTKVEVKREGEVTGKESGNIEGDVGRGIARKRKRSGSVADCFVMFRQGMLQDMRRKHGALPQDHQSAIIQAWHRKRQSFTGVTAETCQVERQRGGASAGKGRRQQAGGTAAADIRGVGIRGARFLQSAIGAIVTVRFQVVMF
jgi:hypothetical protein